MYLDSSSAASQGIGVHIQNIIARMQSHNLPSLCDQQEIVVYSMVKGERNARKEIREGK
jgi:hypothetical protein